MFKLPEVGQKVQVRTQYRSIFFYSQQEYDTHEYVGVVGKPDRSVPEGSFMLLTPDDGKMPTRIIALRNVVDLRYADGAAVGQGAAPDAVKVWQVQGSRGNVYTVTQRGADKTCTCPGFTFRRACKHTQ